MRQILTTRNGGLEVLKVVETPKPTPKTGEVAISVKASGLNFADIMARQGLYPDAPKKPCVLGYEVSGVIEDVGEGVDKGLVGKAVLAPTKFGGQSEVVCVPAEQVFEKPGSLSFEEAAAVPVNYLTAYALLVVMGSLKKEESVLIHNAGGGVGLAALDVAKHIGAKTFGTASESKHAFLKERGLDHAIDYRTRDWLPSLMKQTDGKGVELVIDPMGGANWKKSYQALRATGRMGVFGLSIVSGNRVRGVFLFIKSILQSPRYQPLSLFNSNKGVFGLNLAHLFHEREKIGNWMNTLLHGVEEGWVRPYVGKTFQFSEVAQAHAYIESRSNIGKVILIP